MLSTMNIAQAGLRNWVFNLNGVLADKGIYAGNVAINVFIGANAPAGVPHADPDDIAQSYWNLHTHRDKTRAPRHRLTVSDTLPAGRGWPSSPSEYARKRAANRCQFPQSLGFPNNARRHRSQGPLELSVPTLAELFGVL